MNLPQGEAPIGVFDTGVGGISVLRAIRLALPGENLLYAADSGYAPYGDRDADFIKGRALHLTRFLLAQGAKMIVVACNTITVVAVKELRAWCPVPVVAMEPAIKPASKVTRSGVVGVLATSQTIASASVARLCESQGDHIKFLLQPCPGVVERVEQADLTSDATRARLLKYIEPLIANGADTLVLGCTHYPFLMQQIQAIAGPDVLVIDAGAPVAKEVVRQLGLNKLMRAGGGNAKTSFFSSSDLDTAQTVMSALWGERVTVGEIGRIE